MRALIDGIRRRLSGDADMEEGQGSRAGSRTDQAAIDCVRLAHAASGAIFYSTLPAFAYSLLGQERAPIAAVATPEARWLQIQNEMRAAFRALQRAEAALDRVSDETRIPPQTWSELRRYLTMKRQALLALLNLPLPADARKCGQDLLEICRVVDSWSQQRMDLINELCDGGGPTAGYGPRWEARGFWSRLRQRRRSTAAWPSY